MDLSEVERGFRVIKEFPGSDGVRVYSFSGASLSARVLNLSSINGRFVSQGITQLDRFISLETHGALCEASFQLQPVAVSSIGIFESADEQVWNSIDSQALSTMADREYLDKDQWSFYLQSSNQQTPEQMFYIESYTWISADQLDVYFTSENSDGESPTPWHLISAINSPQSMTPMQLKRAIQNRDPSIRLRIRRSTIRVVADLAVSESTGALQQYPLPFSLEEDIRSVFQPSSPYNYEFGRLSQIPGFESEGKVLSGLATLITSHHNLMVSRAVRGGLPKFQDLLETEAGKIFIHSLEKRHTILYRRAANAKVVPEVSEPNNTLLYAEVPSFIGAHQDVLGQFDFYEEMSIAIRQVYPDMSYGESYLLAYYWVRLAYEATQFNYHLRSRLMARGDQLAFTSMIELGHYYHELEFDKPIRFRLEGALVERTLRQLANEMITEDVIGVAPAEGHSLRSLRSFFVENLVGESQSEALSVQINHPSPRLSRESQGNYRVLSMEYLAHMVNSLKPQLNPLTHDNEELNVLVASIQLNLKSPPSFLRKYLREVGISPVGSPVAIRLEQLPASELGQLLSFADRIDEQGRYVQVYPYEQLVDGLFPTSL